MDTHSESSSQLNTALFIDFDNIFINLAEQDKQAAEKFATNPNRWLGWLESRLPMDYRGGSFTNRRILIRRCYLNPNSFSEYRPHFIRSAFEVIDCPPLTARGKTSTDIHMVMDMLDALSHNTYFHEFIILSGDADFTPVLLNLRKHARYSAVLSVGYASPAYRASCDQLIKQTAFMENALGINYEEEEQTVGNIKEINKSTEKVLKRIADRLYDAAALPTGLPGNDLPEIYKEFPEFKQGNHWLGFYSLKRLTQAVVNQRQDLVMIEDEDSWRVTRQVFATWLYSNSEKAGSAQAFSSSPEDLRGEVAAWIKNLIGASPTPISLGALAQSMIQNFSNQEINSNWLGAGSFKNLLQQLDLDGLSISSGAPDSPGYLYDPARHALPTHAPEEVEVIQKPLEDSFAAQYPELAPLAQKIHQLTDMPYLIPEYYGMLFREIAREVNERGYQMTQTSRTVRDRCIERGAPIARSHVNFMLTGLYYAGYRLGSHKPEVPAKLGEVMVENTVNLCRAAQFELSEHEREQVREWLLSKVDDEQAE